MTIADSEKAVSIARNENLKNRIRSTILKKVAYAIDVSDVDAVAKLAAGKKIWASQENLEIVGLLILADPNILNKCEASAGGAEITDYDLEAKTDTSLLKWGQVLA